MIFLIVWLVIGCIFPQLNLELYIKKKKKVNYNEKIIKKIPKTITALHQSNPIKNDLESCFLQKIAF